MEKKILTLEEVCKYTGFSKSHIYKLTSKRQIPCYSPGNKCLFFKLDELEEWLLQGRRSTQNEVAEKVANFSLKSNRDENCN